MSATPPVIIYSVYDRKMGEFGQLALQKNDETCRRAVIIGVRGSGSMAETHPEDFDLMRIGEFDPVTGFISPVAGPPVLVCNLKTLIGAETHNG